MDRYIEASHQLAEKNPVDEAQIAKVKESFNLNDIEQDVASWIVGDREEKKAFLFERLSGKIGKFFGKQKQYKALLNELQSRQYSSDDEMAKVVSKEIYDFTIQNFSFEQLAQNLEWAQQDQTTENLNEVLSYDSNSKDGSSRLMHIHMEPKENVLAGKKLREKLNYLMEQLNDGLHKLAVLLQTDPRWKNVEIITAASLLVAKHPEVLENLKFKVENHFKGEKRKTRGAFIYREDFLQEYGKDK